MTTNISDPKLKSVRRMIEAILREHDIAGVVVLHNAPGSAEVFQCLGPSYSKLIGTPPIVRLTSKLADYNGDKEAQRKDLEATANMISLLATATANVSLPLLELAVKVDAELGAEHTPLVFRADEEEGK